MKLLSTLSLRQLLTLPYVFLIFGVAILIASLSYRTGSQAVDTMAHHLLLETVARIGQAVDRHVVGSAAVLEAAFPNGMPAPAKLDKDIASLRTRFWIATSLHIDPNNYVYYGSEKGQFLGLWRFNMQDAELRMKLDPDEKRQISRFTGISGALTDTIIEQKHYEPRARPWYKAGETASNHTWTSIYIDFRTSELVATRARRVQGADGALQGVVATDLSLRRLNDFVRKIEVSPNAVAFIIEPDGHLIASSRSPNILSLADGKNARINAADSDNALQRSAYEQVKNWMMLNKKIDKAVTVRFDGPEDASIELAFDRVRDDAGLDWIIAVAVPRQDFMSGVTGNVQRTILIGVLGALAAVLLGLGILSWVGSDIRRLTRAAKAVGEGRLEVELDVHRDDELGTLANTFRHMQHRLRTDMLTGLDNRDVMVRAIESRIEGGRRGTDSVPFAVLFVDLTNFKHINDQLGHAAGDRALIEFGHRLRNSIRPADRVARYAGDEFVLMINELPSRDLAEQLRLTVESILREPLTSINYAELPKGVDTGGSVGLAYYPMDGETADDLIKHADHNMYERKWAARKNLGA